MRYRKAGHSDLQLSQLGLGCWALGGGSYWGESSPQEEKKLLHTAYDLGINYFDTAELYYDGKSETALGHAIKELPRNRIVIGSKLFPTNAYKDKAIDHCEATLRRLDTDYLDIYMLHWPINSRSISVFTDDESLAEHPPKVEETVSDLLKLRDQGKILHIGVSNFGKHWMQEFERNNIQITVNQLPYNAFSRAIEYEVLPYCVQAGSGIIGYSVLMQGVLTDRYQSLDEMPAHYCRTRHFNHKRSPQSRHGESGCEEELNIARGKMQIIARDQGLSMSQLSINWAIRNKAITSVLVGTRNPERLKENAAGAAKSLSEEVYQAVNEITRPIKEIMGPQIDYYESPSNDRTIFSQSR